MTKKNKPASPSICNAFDNEKLSQIEELDISEVPAALIEISSVDGEDDAAVFAEFLLGKELSRLEWPPLVGAKVVLTSLEVATPTRALLERSCDYLSLYFQELDQEIAQCRALVARDTSTSLRDAQKLLVTKVTELEGLGG